MIVVIEKAYAKINLFLNVLGKRKDGYHDLEMINVKIDLCDTLEIRKTDMNGCVIIKSNDLFLSNQDNIVIQTAKYMLRNLLQIIHSGSSYPEKKKSTPN